MPRIERGRSDHGDFHNIYIGPNPDSPEYRKRQREALDHEMDRIGEEIDRERAHEAEFDGKHGADLGRFARGYGQAQRKGSYGFGSVAFGEQMHINDIRPRFAEEVAKGLRAQPEDQQAEWLMEVFKEVERESR